MASAEGETDVLEYVRKVKTSVIRSVEELNPGVQIQDTGHFNHSAAPDLVLSWPGRRGDRPLYVRRSYDELAAGRDIERLAPQTPVFLSVGPRGDASHHDSAEQLGVSGDVARSVLVTNAATMDLFTTRPAQPSSPLTSAVAAQLLPSGQGLLDEEKALPVLEATEDVLAGLAEVLNESALTSVSEIAAIVAAARGAGAEIPRTATETFSAQEARDLLPWLLTDPAITDSSSFWRYVAGRTTLKHLETLSEELAEVELSRLCEAGWSMWQAHRASLGLAISDSAGEAVQSNGWYMRGRLLTYEMDDAAIRLSTYGQAIRERGAVSSATWQAIRDRLEGTRLLGIALRGLSRVIHIDAAESGDVTGDAEAVVGSVEDTYYVDEITLRYGDTEEDRLVRLHLGDQISHNAGSATVRDLMISLANVGAYRNPIDLSNIDDGI